MLLIREGKGVIDQGIEVVPAHILITYMDAAVELGKVDIDPIRILGLLLKKGCVFDHPGVGRKLESIGIAGLVEHLVGFWREVYLKITPRLIGVIAVAGK